MYCQVCGASEEPEIDWEGKLDAVVYKLSQISETLKQIECNTDKSKGGSETEYLRQIECNTRR